MRLDGTVIGWGDNMRGQLEIPQGLSNVVDIAAGSFHGLAIVRQPAADPVPNLEISVAPIGNMVRLRWSGSANVVLESASNAADVAGWRAVTDEISVTETEHAIDVPFTESQCYFRLRLQ